MELDFLPQVLRDKIDSQLINIYTGYVYCIKVDGKILFVLFDLLPLKNIKFYINFPSEWLESMNIKLDTSWLDQWTKHEDCLINNNHISNIILFFDKYKFLITRDLYPSKENGNYKAPFVLNFKTDYLREFENDYLFVSFFKNALIYLKKNKVNYEIKISEIDFKYLYRNILTILKKENFIDSNMLLKESILFVKDEEMKKKVEYYRNLNLQTCSKIFYREEPSEEEINNLKLVTRRDINLKQINYNLINNYLNTEDEIQIFRSKSDVYTARKFNNLISLNNFKNVDDKNLYLLKDFLNKNVNEGIVFSEPSTYFLTTKC